MMRSGKEILSDIDQSVERLRGQIGRQSQQMTQRNQQLANLRQEQAGAYRDLAEIRLELIEQQDLTNQMNRADHKAQGLLSQRVQEMQTLEAALEENRNEQKDTEKSREAALLEHDIFAQKVEAAEVKTHEWLGKETNWVMQEEALEKTSAIAERAADKTRIAQDDTAEKNNPYHADPLFMYLWNRHYGTSEYQAGLLARFLDGWVARLIRFEAARINYSMLNDLPKRLGEHAEHTANLAQAEHEELEVLEQKAFERDGVLLLQNELAEKVKNIEQLDAELTKAEQQHQHITQELLGFAAQEDKYYQQAIDLLMDLYEQEDVYQLIRDAEHTETPQDNRITERLLRLQTQLEKTERDAREQAPILRAQHQRLEELQQARHQFKQRHYDGYDVTFQNPELIGVLLEQVLSGSFDAGRLLQQLTDLYVSRPRFRHRRKGGFSFPSDGRVGGSWGGSSGGLRFPSGGGGSGGSANRSRGSGGFRTGGGF